MTTPKTLADLRYMEFTGTVTGTYHHIEGYAAAFFKDAGITGTVKINFLFTEGDAKVYECYVDSGSIDYLYVELYAA